MTDRWFSEHELEQLSRPTMDRALEALDRGDLDVVRRLCSEMKHEWQMLHDLMASGLLDLVSFIQQRLGDQGVAEAWEESMGRGWRRHHDAIVALDRRELVGLSPLPFRPAGGLLEGPVQVVLVQGSRRDPRAPLAPLRSGEARYRHGRVTPARPPKETVLRGRECRERPPRPAQGAPVWTS